jgi:hypothetical protein
MDEAHPAATIGRTANRTPDRRPRSVRRTSTHDPTRPQGLDGALASVEGVRNQPTAGLRRHVLTQLVDPSTCTHLNDQLRSLEDIGTLIKTIV